MKEEFDVIVEISSDSSPVKYEVDKQNGSIRVDRIMRTAMHYPCNYGFIPDTLAEDGDPCDAMIISSFPIMPGAFVKCRAIGVLLMSDEAGRDEKILCLPVQKIDPFYKKITSIDDLEQDVLDRIKHFFEHYKDIDSDKWVKVEDWQGVDHAYNLIDLSIKRAK